MTPPGPTASHVLDRVLVLEMVRVTEAAAIAASKWIGRGDNGDEADTNGLIREIVALRQKRAEVLGYRNHAEMVLDVERP